MINIEFISLQEAADSLKVNKVTLLRAVRAGKLEAYKIGGEHRCTPEALAKYVESCKSQTKHEQ